MVVIDSYPFRLVVRDAVFIGEILGNDRVRVLRTGIEQVCAGQGEFPARLVIPRGPFPTRSMAFTCLPFSSAETLRKARHCLALEPTMLPFGNTREDAVGSSQAGSGTCFPKSEIAAETVLAFRQFLYCFKAGHEETEAGERDGIKLDIHADSIYDAIWIVSSKNLSGVDAFGSKVHYLPVFFNNFTAY
jgi:hypothetical protein